MKYVIQAIIIGLMMFTFNTVKADTQDVYVMSPKYHNVKVEDVKDIRTAYHYIDIDDLKMLADLTNDFGYGKITSDTFNMLFKGGKIISVDLGYYKVVFVEEYNNWWVWKISK